MGEYCKIHKNDSMVQTMTFINYDPTNIRAEGLAIVYALMYLKFVIIDNITRETLVNHFNTFQFENPKLQFVEYKIPVDTAGYTFYQIITDSEFWINVITKWSNGWIKQNKILEKKNIDIIYYINILLNALFDNKIIIHFQFVRGHADTKKNKDSKYTIYQKGNIMADKLANIAKENSNNNVKISFE
jgi:ribonuclease HI